MLLLPVALHNFVPSGFGLSGKQRGKFVGSLASIEWRYQWLHNTDRAVVGARVPPRFEIMRLVHMPLAEFGSLVLIKPEMYAHRNIRVFEGIGEVEISGRIVGGISAQDEQHVHFVGAHVG